jgi:2-keto-4-pentenoate hydratase/2-oxohepta-3-ene-1,7-dioic acid hydratase in catechol pathway
MIFSVATLIHEISRGTTLLPGTLILTGTPSGVGFTRQPPVFLKDGDTVTVSVEKIGEVTSRVRAEPATNG